MKTSIYVFKEHLFKYLNQSWKFIYSRLLKAAASQKLKKKGKPDQWQRQLLGGWQYPSSSIHSKKWAPTGRLHLSSPAIAEAVEAAAQGHWQLQWAAAATRLHYTSSSWGWNPRRPINDIPDSIMGPSCELDSWLNHCQTWLKYTLHSTQEGKKAESLSSHPELVVPLLCVLSSAELTTVAWFHTRWSKTQSIYGTPVQQPN